jgi:hypothetical protein
VWQRQSLAILVAKYGKMMINIDKHLRYFKINTDPQLFSPCDSHPPRDLLTGSVWRRTTSCAPTVATICWSISRPNPDA